MVNIYEITNSVTNDKYVGITKNSLSYRWASHKYSSKYKTTYLYNAIRKYGITAFKMTLLTTSATWEEACVEEMSLIATGVYKYNNSKGGDGGFNVVNTEQWKEKLCAARKGGKPALGMQHTKQNKEFFSEVSNAYWKTQYTYPSEVTEVPFKEALATYGISKTHYYRLKKTRRM